MKINRENSEVEEDKEWQLRRGLNWQILWQLSTSTPHSKSASALSSDC
jgi:hypothetical protein